MVARVAILTISSVLIVGCNGRNNDVDVDVQGQATGAAAHTDHTPVDRPFSDDPSTDNDWNLSGATGVIDSGKTVDFEIGDLVPCSDDRTEYVLEIRAMNGSNCFYRREQGFQRYNREGDDPENEPGMIQENVVCAMLVDGFASGTLRYTDLAPDAVTVEIEWQASQSDREEKFTGTFTPRIDESGIVDAGNGNVFSWSFPRKD